jgi:hypothetical protein
MRAVECFCGEYLESRTDAGLLETLNQHIEQEHPGQYSEADIRAHLAANAYDGARVST